MNWRHESPLFVKAMLSDGHDVRAAPAASLAGKSRLKIRKPDVIRPSIAADRGPMRAMIIGAVDQEAANGMSYRPMRAHRC